MKHSPLSKVCSANNILVFAGIIGWGIATTSAPLAAELEEGFCYDGPLETDLWGFMSKPRCDERGGVLLLREDCAYIIPENSSEACKSFKLNKNFRIALSKFKDKGKEDALKQRQALVINTKVLLTELGLFDAEINEELNLRFEIAIDKFLKTIPEVDQSGFLYQDSLGRTYPTTKLVGSLEEAIATREVTGGSEGNEPVGENGVASGLDQTPAGAENQSEDPGFVSVEVELEPMDRVLVVQQPTNLRSKPDVLAPRVIQVPAKAVLTLLGRVPGKDWYLAETDQGVRGFVFADAVSSENRERSRPEGILVKDAPSDRDYGAYFALVIGNNDYRSFPDLRTAVNDAREVARVLEIDYGFQVTLILDATRADIYAELAKLRTEVGPSDNLLIYYGGHGWLDKDADEGYWLPIDAEEGNPVNWISSSNLISEIRRSSAKHLLVVADSCFSGTLTRGITILNKTPDYRDRIAKKKARVVLTSGGLEPVLDTGGGANSVFAKAFLSVLGTNQSVLDGHELFSRLRAMVVSASDQTPEYGEMLKAGHDGGDFLFVRR